MAEIVESAGPNHRVSLTNNMVDGKDMAGGYAAWQLLPFGSQVAPVNSKHGPFNVANSTKLVMTTQDGGRDVYLPNAGVSFIRDELVTIQGPNDQDGNKSVIIMMGQTSTLTVAWTFDRNSTN